MTFILRAAQVFRDFVTNGVPSSGKHEPKKSEIRGWARDIESALDALAVTGNFQGRWNASSGLFPSGSQKGYSWIVGVPGSVSGRFFAEGDRLVALMNGASTSIYADNWVVVPAGASGVTSAVDLGEGTANSIRVKTEAGGGVREGSLIAFGLFRDTTSSPVTVSVDGGAAITVKSNAGTNVSALTAGQFVLGQVRSGELRLVNDQDITALAAQAEDAAERAESAAAGVTLPSAVADTMLVQKSDASGYEAVDKDGIRAFLDPTEDLLTGEGFFLTYHKARGSISIKAFGASKTAVGGGNASNDTAALQDAINSGEIIDIQGTALQVTDVIDVNIAGASINGTTGSSRVGSNAASSITVVDDDIPQLFFVRHANFEASGFYVTSSTENNATTYFHFQREAGAASDIDAELEDIGVANGAKAFHIYGRGLKINNMTTGNVNTCVGDVDWPEDWTPNGQSNDTQETGFRAYEFHNIRMHGGAAGIRNVGVNAANLRGFIGSNWLADIGNGGGMFIGVATPGVMINGIYSNSGAVINGHTLDLYDGSNGATFLNLKHVCSRGTVTRLNRNAVVLRPSEIGIRDISIIGGTIGPLNRSGVDIVGYGVVDNLKLSDINFDRTNIEGTLYSPIRVLESGGTYSKVLIKLANCDFQFGSEIAANYIVGGVNSDKITLMKDSLTTKPSEAAWAQSSVVVV